MGQMAAKQNQNHKLAVQEENQVQEPEKENMEIEQVDQISVENQKYPFCIVWTSIPVITWLIPCIGHTGICTSEGTIHDFGGPYFIAIDNFTFGKPLKYVRLNKEFEVSRQTWDDAVLKADDEFGQQMHNLFTNNCHSHVAKALINMKYKGKQSYTMFHIWLMLIISGQYVRYLCVYRLKKFWKICQDIFTNHHILWHHFNGSVLKQMIMIKNIVHDLFPIFQNLKQQTQIL